MDEGPWLDGAARYFTDMRQGPHTLVVGARCRVGSLEAEELALLDTGAQWSIISGELAELVEPDLGEAMGALRMHTRFGEFDGSLRRLNITLVADEGNNLEVSATVLVLHDWPGPTVLGYHGLFERVCFALDPGVEPNNEWLHFGAVIA